MIRLTFPNDIYHPTPVSRACPADPKTVQSVSCTQPVQADRIQISPEGSFKSFLAAYVKTAAGEIAESVSPQRLENLQRQIEAGAYQVPSARLADCLLNRETAQWEGQGDCQ